ncbi:dihydroxyacetone kinase subunit DhaL [Alkalicoccus halolimnae]|uniref:phosphoenolpyruvate--glycerone phosphotransferase n=1 Tax=Alkalicoccus halolimnae TaxID=1667239 RepID=A0A5C7FF32_9BACI|nr:dihydroxyacetone kinase subunit DhaL [Alkalicoccus halolimnae]TXF85907.1 dihydroxyacetone kinase subunit L [Alkalicoccus halolimnae]
MSITAEHLRTWLERFHDEILEHKDELTDLDQAIGDGDHGINMARGVKEMHKMLNGKSFDAPGDLLKAVSMTFIGKIGGASGPLYGSALMKMASRASSDETLTEEEWINVLEAGKVAIQQRGKAETGEKTMVDVWAPLIERFQKQKEIDWQLFQTTAEELMQSTKEMHAKKGRAAYLGARSVGHIDPGAMSSYLFFKTLAETLQERS